MENDCRIKKINMKEETEFHKKEINAIILAEIKGEDIDITSDSDNGEDELEILAAVREGQTRDPWDGGNRVLWKERKLVVNVF